MSAAKTHTVGNNIHATESANKNLAHLDKVRAIFASLSKYIHAKTIYASNNPHVGKFAGVFYDSFKTIFKHEKELVLTIEQYQIRWNDEVVYNNTEKNTSIAFLLFKDGVGEITIYSAVKQTELDHFVDLIKNEIYNPSAHLDIVSRLWQAEFKDIHYRVFDECTDGASGEGGKTGSDSQEQPLRVNDHRNTDSTGDEANGAAARANNPFNSLGSYLAGVVENGRPGASTLQKEEFLQSTLDSMFKTSSEELESWREEFFSSNDQDKLLWLLDTMVDFTQVRSTPAKTRDILDVIDRVVRYIIAEAKIPALITLLEVKEKIEQSPATVQEFQILPERIYRELTNNAFLLLLGKNTSTSRDGAREALRFFHLIGKVAVPGIRELLKNSRDPLVHKDACDALLAITGPDIMPVVEDFDLENHHDARDAVYLLQRAFPAEVPPAVNKIASSPDPQIRHLAIELLIKAKSDEAAALLCRLMEDPDSDVRVKAYAGVEKVSHPAVVKKMISLCFGDINPARSVDELERMFRTLGILAGEKALPSLKQMIKKKGWIPLGKSRGKQDKLLVITALRHIPGRTSVELLRKLADDRDSHVRTKASYVLKRIGKPEDEPVLQEVES